MTKFFNKLKKTPVFGPFLVNFCNFWGKKFFPENLALSCTDSYGFLALCQNLEKTNATIPRKQTDRWKDGRMEWQKDRRIEGRNDRRTAGRKDRQTLFHRTLTATTEGSKMQNQHPLVRTNTTMT